jgi:deoxyribodipyrimidine photo-lyase
MIAARRLRSNFALERAVALAREHRKPLVIFEPLRAGYRWANDRLHQFVIDGMAEHARVLGQTPVTYVPYVEPAPGDGRGLLEALAADAVAVVTDDYPAFFLPRMIARAARDMRVQFEAVDSNGLLPMRAAGRAFVTAFSHRAYIHNTFREHLQTWPGEIRFDDLPRLAALPEAVTRRWAIGVDRTPIRLRPSPGAAAKPPRRRRSRSLSSTRSGATGTIAISRASPARAGSRRISTSATSARTTCSPP